MIDIRIVCTHDAAKVAEMLTRLLEAEQHVVRLTMGRQAYHDLEATQDSEEAVLMIWSPAAPGQEYMLAWAERTAPERLVEISRAPGAPKIQRLSPVIDFASWRGERGGRAWNALNDRLRAVTRVYEPPKGPSQQAVMLMGLASVFAVGGAVAVRMNDIAPMQTAQTSSATSETLTFADAGDAGIGGANVFVEPPSADDVFHLPRAPSRIAMLPQRSNTILATLDPNPPMEIRDPTLLERLQGLNPLRDFARDDDGQS